MTLHAIRSQPLENALKHWYVIQTQFKQELTAQENLERQGFKTFLPQYMKPRKKGVLTLPLFSGYLFVSFNKDACRWQKIHHTIGVSRILGYNEGANSICPVKQGFVEGLQAFCDDGGVIDMEKAFPSAIQAYSQGETVKILKGMFEGQTATYWNCTKNGAMVILSLLNRPVRVILRNEEITRQ